MVAVNSSLADGVGRRIEHGPELMELLGLLLDLGLQEIVLSLLLSKLSLELMHTLVGLLAIDLH